jgi:hypothetical protein
MTALKIRHDESEIKVLSNLPGLLSISRSSKPFSHCLLDPVVVKQHIKPFQSFKAPRNFVKWVEIVENTEMVAHLDETFHSCFFQKYEIISGKIA